MSSLSYWAVFSSEYVWIRFPQVVILTTGPVCVGASAFIREEVPRCGGRPMAYDRRMVRLRAGRACIGKKGPFDYVWQQSSYTLQPIGLGRVRESRPTRVLHGGLSHECRIGSGVLLLIDSPLVWRR